ncbi:MAG: excinuclease ABC subunit UvrC, partial [Candidatus Zixiibacteriota bacterium]
MDLKAKLKSLPKKPGVYMMKDSRGRIIYVGKAKSLKNRVRSYFQDSLPPDPKQKALIKKISDFDLLVADSEMEALILESNLIKEHKPRYNVNLKDDKRYPYLKVTVDEDFPRILVVRRVKKDKAKYFGPYTNVRGMRQTLRLLRRIFQVRSCNFALPSKKKHKLCLDYHIKRCQGPCEGLVKKDEYRGMIKDVCLFLSGKNTELIKELKRKMEKTAEAERYEEAARIRDQIKFLESVMHRQKVVETEKKDRDIIALSQEGKDVSVAALQIREGVMIGRQNFHVLASTKISQGEILSNFLRRYYMHSPIIPQQIILPSDPNDRKMIQKWLKQKREANVEFVTPKKGKKYKLLEMAQKNAKLLLDELLLQKKEREKKIPEPVATLKKDLYLEKAPREIAGIDISNIGGKDAVGSLVYFSDGKPKKSEYKRFRIKTVATQDDFAMISEVVKRYYGSLIESRKSFPDLVLIDGGKGQLSLALQALNSLGIKDQKIMALAKRIDEIFLPGKPDPLMIKKDSSSLKLLKRVRDEAHRFAISYHKLLRKKRTVASELDKIPGVGEKRRKVLLTKFGSVKRIKETT